MCNLLVIFSLGAFLANFHHAFINIGLPIERCHAGNCSLCLIANTLARPIQISTICYVFLVVNQPDAAIVTALFLTFCQEAADEFSHQRILTLEHMDHVASHYYSCKTRVNLRRVSAIVVALSEINIWVNCRYIFLLVEECLSPFCEFFL